MDITIIGGGASGMAAAIAAAREGANVTIFEKEARVGRKLLATGNGKCNYSNTNYEGRIYNEGSEDFVDKVLKAVSPEETLAFFKDLGIYPRFESEGRVYPASEQAASVVDALRFELDRLPNIEVINSHWIKGIVRREATGGFFTVSHQNMRKHADRVIIACGGRAGSQYGCEGDGFVLAEAQGHSLVEPKPALVQLTCSEKYFTGLKGVRAKGEVTLLVKGKDGEIVPVGSEKGEIQFTETGISGICVFDLSGRANRAMEEGSCAVVIDLFPELSVHDFVVMMKDRLEKSKHKSCENFLNGLINKKLIPVILKESGIKKIEARASEITQEQLKSICRMLKQWRVGITGSKSWNDAQTTSGGIKLEEVNPETMESKLQKGLFFAGEVLDVDGRCGGYNLQWAWSSGILAGQKAATMEKE